MVDDIKNMPKVELHLHLDGSVNVNTVSELLKLSLEDVKNKMIVKGECQSLTEYLTKFDLPISLMQTKENLKRVSMELALNLKKENVIYAEIRFAPAFHIKQGLSYDDVVTSVIEGLNSVKEVKTNVILCMMRNLDKSANLKTLEIAKKYLNRGVCAVDLAGDEIKYPIEDYKILFNYAKMNNIPFTIHAGETSSAKEVKTAINYGAKRIGHGIKAIDDLNVINLIKGNNILLEICPTSNVQTNVVGAYEKHPVLKLFDLGVDLSISTDNNTVSNVSITEEYIKLNKYFKFNIDDFKKMNVNAISHAFITEEEKDELIKLIDKY